MRNKCSYSNREVARLVIKVKLIGALKKLAESSEVHLETRKGTLTLSEVIRRLCDKVSRPEFTQAIIDPSSGTVGPHIIILVNDRDISVLRGLETEIGSNDAVTLVPVAHGG